MRTRIVGVEGKYADHLTTTTALQVRYFLTFKLLNRSPFLFLQ